MATEKLTMHHPEAGEASTTRAAFVALWEPKGWRLDEDIVEPEPTPPVRKSTRRSRAFADLPDPPNPTDPVAEPSADNQEES